MSYVITKQPLKYHTPVGQDLVFTVLSSNASSATKYKYKYIAEIYATKDYPTLGSPINTVLFSQNKDNYGITDLSNILEQFLSADNLGRQAYGISSRFKNTAFNAGTSPHPIHCIDKFSINTNSVTYWFILFKEQYALTPNGAVSQYSGTATAALSNLFNGVDYGLEQSNVNAEYGIDLSNWNGRSFTSAAGTVDSGNFLTNSPDNLYIDYEQYHTMAFLAGLWNSTPANGENYYNCTYTFLNAAGGTISTLTTNITAANGGYVGSTDILPVESGKQLLYVGCGTGNLLNLGTTIPANTVKYSVALYSSGGVRLTPNKYFNLKTPDCKGYETIRLTWLNKYGVWDYYNFTKKSIKSTEINREEYKGIIGNWNDGIFTKNGYDRGRTVLNTNANKKIICNSDWFRTDAEAAWLEELFISNEVNILNDYDVNDTGANGAEYGKYITPVIVSSKKYEKYTEANDKVAQYEIEIEYASNMRIQKG